MGFPDQQSAIMRKAACSSNPRHLNPRRAAAPAVALSALVAAWVLVASEPAVGGEAVHDINSAPLLMSQLVTTGNDSARIVQVAQRDQPRGTPLFGEISSIEPIKQSSGTTGTGAVVGGVLGAVLGNQVGDGSGRAAATVIGGVGGAVAGNAVEKKRAESVVGYRVHVRLDNGSSRSFERKDLNGLDVGSRVRIQNGSLRGV